MMQELQSIQEDFYGHVQKLQDEVTKNLQDIDPHLNLEEKIWDRKDFLGNPGGGGRTRAFTGSIVENAGVNTSWIHGEIDPVFAKQLALQEGRDPSSVSNYLSAAGISLIIHPFNPHAPTVHMNFRMIIHDHFWWFGGGADLTPYCVYEEDCRFFHQVWKKNCDELFPEHYPVWKKECDQYFSNHHRVFSDGVEEMRGVGGIFFDYFRGNNNLKETKNKIQELSKAFSGSFFPIFQKRYQTKYSASEIDFQEFRRGRYVEFNLLHDRGTLFGLKTKGRTESILISLPKRAQFHYNYQPKDHFPFEETMKYYKPKEWV